MSNYLDKPQPDTNHLKKCQDFFRQSAVNFEASHMEAELVQSLYDDNHYTQEQIHELKEEGRPIETYNVIKKYTRNLTGYLSTVVTDITVKPTSYEHVQQAKLRNSTVQYLLGINNWSVLQDDLNEMTALTGLTTIKYTVQKTGKKDTVGREVTTIKLQVVPSKYILPDPLDNSYDYSTARYTHEWSWLPEDEVKRLFGSRKLKKLRANQDISLDMPLTGIDYNFLYIEEGKFKRHNMYLIVRTVMKSANGKYTDTYWCGNHQLSKKDLDYNPYRCFRLHKGKKYPEFYGVFREVIESQKAINQAVLQIQLLVNSSKIIVEEQAVDDIHEFRKSYNRVNAVVEVLDISGYKLENLNPDIVANYRILDGAIQRIQAILGINDSFLGLADASDSGRKVQLQQNSSVVALRYFTKHIEHIYSTIGKDLSTLSQRYMTAHTIMRASDDIGNDTWNEINRPFAMPMEELDKDGNVQYQHVVNPILDGDNNFVLDESGNITHTIVNEPDTDMSVDLDMDIEVKTSAYGESEEIQRVVLEAMMNGNPGMMLQQINPIRYAQLIELYAKSLKSEHSPALVELFRGVQEDLGGLENRDPRDSAEGRGQQAQQGNISANTGALQHAAGSSNDKKGSAGLNTAKGQ